MWDTEWVGTWICRALGYVRHMEARDTKTNMHDYVEHRMNRYDYARQLEARDTKRIDMIM